MTTLIATAFGHLSPTPNLPASSAEEDLYSVFLARSEMMRWSDLHSTTESQRTSALWAMNEAELTYVRDGREIGFVQVGLTVGPTIDATAADPHAKKADDEGTDVSSAQYAPARYPVALGTATDPEVSISPLLQCLDDSLRRFGEVDVTAFQVTATDMHSERRSDLRYLGSVLNWFNFETANPVLGAIATIAADEWDERMAIQTFTLMQRARLGLCGFEGMVRVPKDDAAGEEMLGIEWASTDTGVVVSMPEWSPAAIGWLIATLFDAVRSHHPATRHLSVRVTRSTA